jgi:hypothetical protein
MDRWRDDSLLWQTLDQNSIRAPRGCHDLFGKLVLLPEL